MYSIKSWYVTISINKFVKLIERTRYIQADKQLIKSFELAIEGAHCKVTYYCF